MREYPRTVPIESAGGYLRVANASLRVVSGTCPRSIPAAPTARSRIRTYRQPWPNRGPQELRPWPDCSVRRIVEVTFPVAHAAVSEFVATLLDTPARHRGPAVMVRGDPGWLEFRPTDAVTRHDEWRLPGALHLHRFGRPTPVELVLASWSAARSELRLELRCRRGISRVPPRYFDVAHAVMDELRSDVETMVEKVAPGTLSRADDDRPLATIIQLADVRARHVGEKQHRRRRR